MVSSDPANPNYHEETVRADSPEENQVLENFKARGWVLEGRLEIAARQGYVRMMFRKEHQDSAIELDPAILITVDVRDDEQEERFTSRDPIRCRFRLPAEDLKKLYEDFRWGNLSHYKRKGRLYKISALDPDGTFVMRLDD